MNNSIDIALLQEHNVKDISKIGYLNHFYFIIVNKSILLKGGTLIAIDRKLPCTIGYSYFHPSSRLTTLYVNIFDTRLYFVNVYAPSGQNKEREREEFFENELMQSLITNTDNIILAGDWNSVLSRSDSAKPDNTPLSRALKYIINNLRFKGSHSTQMHLYFPFKTINFN